LKRVQFGLVVVLLSFVVPVFGQQQSPALVPVAVALTGSFGVPEGRMFLPHDWIRGYTDAEIAPSHNEPDLGRCAGPASQFGGIASPCDAFARYMLSGYLELQPIGRTALRHFFVFITPRFSFGRNVPQFSYTGSFSPIAYDRSVGIGIELPKNFELRLTQHRVDWLGRYDKSLGPGDLGTTGPYGLYTTAGLRWYFGGYGRSRAAM
jgi:hypothetical protein